MFTKRINSVDEPFDMPVGHTGRIAILDIEATHRERALAYPLEIGAVISDPLDPPEAYLRPENQFSALVKPPQKAIFRSGTDIEKLRAVGALRDIEHPAFLKAVLSEEVHTAFRLHKITPEELYAKGKPIEEVMLAFQSWMKERGVSTSTAFNIPYDRSVLERFGLSTEWGTDIMIQAKEMLGLRSGEGSAENVARLLGVLGQEEKEIHRGLADAVLEARIVPALSNPIVVESALSQLRQIRGEKRTIISGLGRRISKGIDLSIFKQITAENIEMFAKKNPVLAAAGVGMMAFAVGSVAKPLALIPGRDDEYNTIPGLNEQGIAADLRKIHTDFGSGYQGLRVMGQPIAPEIQAFREAWFSDLNDQARIDQLKAEIAASSIEYGKFEPPELQQVDGRLQRVDLSEFDVRWDDADTLILRRTGLVNFFFGKRKDIAIRLTGIDAPEVVHPDDPTAWFRFQQQQPFGAESTMIAEALTAGKKLEVVIDPGATTYGRYIGLLYAGGEARSINEQLIAAGAAAHLPFGEAGSDIYPRKEYAAAEQEAISAGRGMWQEPFFQTYLDVTKGVGGRITFTTFTDLSRLARNYKLAAAQQAMWSAQETGMDQNAYRIGTSLRPSYGRFFHSNQNRISSKDDDYNTIEALGHSGIASSIRKAMTDFGSGFVGALFGGIKPFMKASKSEIKTKFDKWLKDQYVTIIPSLAGLPPSSSIQPIFGSVLLKRIIPGSEANIPALLKMFKIQNDPKKVKLLIDPISMHEGSELYYGMKYFQNWRGGKTLKRFGSHLSPGVIVDEMLTSSKLGIEHWNAMKEFRLGELAQLEKHPIAAGLFLAYQKAGGKFFGTLKAYPAVSKDLSRYISQTRRMYATFEKKWLPKFAEEDTQFGKVPILEGPALEQQFANYQKMQEKAILDIRQARREREIADWPAYRESVRVQMNPEERAAFNKAARKSGMAEAQKTTQMHNSTNGIFGGKGHRGYNNKGD